MRVPAELLEGTVIYDVQGRNDLSFGENIRFGPYAAKDFHRGWKTIFTLGVSHWSTSDIDTSFSLDMTGASKEWNIQCSTNLDRHRLDFHDLLGGRGELTMELSSRTHFACALQEDAGGPKWLLTMNRGEGEFALDGVLSGPSRRIDISGITEVENISLPVGTAAGYFFVERGSTIGGVEVINKGRVFLPRNEDDAMLAAVSMALLYYRDERGELL